MEKADNVILIGKKSPTRYALAILTSIKKVNTEVFLKARGRSILTCIDATQILKNRFEPTIQLEAITIGTELVDFKQKDGSTRQSNISSIEIKLKVP